MKDKIYIETHTEKIDKINELVDLTKKINDLSSKAEDIKRELLEAYEDVVNPGMNKITNGVHQITYRKAVFKTQDKKYFEGEIEKLKEKMAFLEEQKELVNEAEPVVKKTHSASILIKI